jgi:hypothetical protein
MLVRRYHPAWAVGVLFFVLRHSQAFIEVSARVEVNCIYEWDTRKAKANRRRHGVAFEEAATIFLDPLA